MTCTDVLGLGLFTLSEEMSTLWIHGGTIPPCPCDAPTQDQVRRPDGADRRNWCCLVCGLYRTPPTNWPDQLVPITEDDLRARNAAMAARVRARWRANEPESGARPDPT